MNKKIIALFSVLILLLTVIVTAETVNSAVVSGSNQAQTQNITACPKKRICSYPGKCREYIDTNKNNICDKGEVLQGTFKK